MRKAQVAEQASLLALIDDMYAICALVDAVVGGTRALHRTINRCRTGHMARRRCLDAASTGRDGKEMCARLEGCRGLPSSVRVGSAANLQAAVVLESRTAHRASTTPTRVRSLRAAATASPLQRTTNVSMYCLLAARAGRRRRLWDANLRTTPLAACLARTGTL